MDGARHLLRRISRPGAVVMLMSVMMVVVVVVMVMIVVMVVMIVVSVCFCPHRRWWGT